MARKTQATPEELQAHDGDLHPDGAPEETGVEGRVETEVIPVAAPIPELPHEPLMDFQHYFTFRRLSPFEIGVLASGAKTYARPLSDWDAAKTRLLGG